VPFDLSSRIFSMSCCSCNDGRENASNVSCQLADMKRSLAESEREYRELEARKLALLRDVEALQAEKQALETDLDTLYGTDEENCFDEYLTRRGNNMSSSSASFSSSHLEATSNRTSTSTCVDESFGFEDSDSDVSSDALASFEGMAMLADSVRTPMCRRRRTSRKCEPTKKRRRVDRL